MAQHPPDPVPLDRQPAGSPTDEQLLSRFASGDDDALGKLARRYEGSLLGLASGLLSGREDLARDAVQDAWMRVIRHAGKFDGRSSTRTWLYRIVINRCSDLRASALAEKKRSAASAAGTTGDHRPPSVENDGPLSARVRTAADALDPGKRLILLLCYHRGLTHAQVAEVLEIPIGTLKSRLHAALEDLRRRLAPQVLAARDGALPPGTSAREVPA